MNSPQPSRISSRLTLTVLIALPAALASSRAAAQARIPTHVACVGDSITQGVGASSSDASYPSVLQTMFGSSVHVGNYGHSGATMLSDGDLPYQNQSEYTGATSFVSGAGASAVVDVIIMLGTNDSKSQNWTTSTGTRAQQYVTDCTAMVDHFASLPTHPVIYLALPPAAFANKYGISGTVIHDQILPLIHQVAAAKGLPVIDVNTPTATHSDLFPDGVHPNDAGYQLVAQTMHAGLLRVPQVMLTQPSAGAALTGSAITLAATATGDTVAITGVEFFFSAGAGQPTSIGRRTAAPFTTTWTGVAPGSYRLTAKATDSTGAATTSSAVAVTVRAVDGGQGGAAGQGGEGGAGGRSGALGQGGGGGAVASGGAGGAAGTGESGGTAGSAGGGGAGAGGGSGCSCGLPNARQHSGVVALLLAALAVFSLRRRRTG